MNPKFAPFAAAFAAALLLAGCAASAPKPEAAAQAAPEAGAETATAAAATAELSPEDRNSFFVNFARTGDLASVKKELAAGIDVNVHDSLGQTALLAAVSHSALPVVNELIAHHADVNAADTAGWTPLHYAAYFGAGNELIAALLKGGASIDARNDRGITPLYFATALAHAEQVKFLLEHGADRAIASNSGFTPLKVAQTKGYDGIAALFDPAAKPAAASSGGTN